MPVFNFVTGEILFRIACLGPPFSGKSSALHSLHERIDTPAISPVRTERAGPDRLLAFDFALKNRPPQLPAAPRIELLAIPGAPLSPATSARALDGIDGIAFIADSRWDKIEENVRALETLASLLRADGAQLENTPLVLLYNKRDLPGAAPLPYLEFVLNNRSARWPAFEVGAHTGRNLVPALDTLLKIILAKHAPAGGDS